MKTIQAVLAGLLLAGSGWPQPASAQGVPPGTYLRSCGEVHLRGDELVATWGNLAHRTLVNAHRNFGAVPEPQQLNEGDKTLIKEVEDALDYVATQLGQGRFQVALRYAMTMAAKVNVYLGTEQPWHVIKTDKARAGTVLYVALRCVATVPLLKRDEKARCAMVAI